MNVMRLFISMIIYYVLILMKSQPLIQIKTQNVAICNAGFTLNKGKNIKEK